jgi:hypothetical protein
VISSGPPDPCPCRDDGRSRSATARTAVVPVHIARIDGLSGNETRPRATFSAYATGNRPDAFCWRIAWQAESPSNSNRSRLGAHTDYAMTKVLRSLCVLLTILIVALGVVHLVPEAAAGEPLVAAGHSAALSHSGHLGFEDVSKHRSCVSAGPCWSVPPGAAVLPPRPDGAKPKPAGSTGQTLPHCGTSRLLINRLGALRDFCA